MSTLTSMRSFVKPRAKPQSETPAPDSTPDQTLIAERDRLVTRFTVLQCELGGLFYEMAIRDHVRLDVLLPKAAALQRVDAELAQVEHLISQGPSAAGGHCPSCGVSHARGAAFCSHCGQPLS